MKSELERIADARHDGVSSKDGLLWVQDAMVPLPHADALARVYGFVWAEDLVRALAIPASPP